MIPCLPSQDPRPAARRASIAHDRERYIFQHAYTSPVLPNGIALADHLPPADQFDARFYHAAAPLDLRVAANSMLVQLLETGEELFSHTHTHSLLGLLGIERTQANGAAFPKTHKALLGVTASFPPDLSSYDSLFKLLPLPAVAGVLESSPMLQDRLFAWQRIAGANPLVLRAVRRVPPREPLVERVGDTLRTVWDRLRNRAPQPSDGPAPGQPGDLPPAFLVTDADVQKSMPGQTLASLAGAGRLFVCDYSITVGLPTGDYNSGLLGITRKKRLYSPYALFATTLATDEQPSYLTPLAIQCEHGALEAHVFTPADGIAWKMAKTVVQQADSTTQELVSHLARTHLILEAVILSARREMAPWHPIRVLIDAHGYNTLAINDFAAHHLIAPGGQVEQLFAATLEGNLELASRGLADFTFAELAPFDQAAERGVAKGESALADYPWRDDAMLLWPIVERMVARYVQIYYGSNQDVADDTELQSFVRVLGAPDGGSIPGVPEVRTVEALVGAMARIVWTASLQHACMNNAQYDYLGYAPSAPGALYAEAPKPGTPLAQTDWMAMLPPISGALAQAALLYQLANVRILSLGQFPEGTFVDPRAEGVLELYRKELGWAETLLVGRDKTRFLPYPYLRPSQAGNSVFI